MKAEPGGLGDLVGSSGCEPKHDSQANNLGRDLKSWSGLRISGDYETRFANANHFVLTMPITV